MGRAIVREPAAFLMDEPLSNLDARLRIQMRTEMAQLQRRLRTTTLYVTHDQTEAMTMGDRVAVMRWGALQQVDRPQALYDRPRNLFVAEFMGSPAMNLVLARLERTGERRVAAVFGSHRLTVPPQTFERCPDLGSFIGQELALGIRPEDIHDATMVPGADTGRRLRVTASVVEPLGAELILHFPIEGRPAGAGYAREAAPRTQNVADGTAGIERVGPGVKWTGNEGASDGGGEAEQGGGDPDGTGSLNFIARLTPRLSAGEKETRTLVVYVERLYFFDPATHEAIAGPGF